jgi:transcriptional regulator with XRE-family HTH domain
MIPSRGIGKTVHSADQTAFCALMIAVRKAAGLTQSELARRLRKPQSFVAKYEGGERRLDVVEFVAVVRAIGGDPVRLLRDFVKGKAPPTGRGNSTK